jgi:hypothetical protein
MVLQDSSQTYDNKAFNGVSVSALTGTAAGGVNTNVSLTLGSTDGNGNFSGLFDQNNGGVILSGAQFPPTTGANNYTYAAGGTSGRYTFNMLGNPTTTPAGAPLPFVLYASGANRGFLLDQKSSSVMTGTMNPQGKGRGFSAVRRYRVLTPRRPPAAAAPGPTRLRPTCCSHGGTLARAPPSASTEPSTIPPTTT